MTYELMYGRGGHGGPWPDLATATRGAQRYLDGCRTERTVYVVPRDTRPLQHANAVHVVSRVGACRECGANQ